MKIYINIWKVKCSMINVCMLRKLEVVQYSVNVIVRTSIIQVMFFIVFIDSGYNEIVFICWIISIVSGIHKLSLSGLKRYNKY